MSSENVFFFTGENEYLLQQELSLWKKKFCEKHGEENLLVIPAKGATVSSILDAIAIMPFLAEKRLVILDGVPKFEKEEMQNIIDSVHPQNIVAFVDAKPDKRLAGVKYLRDHSTLKEFEQFNPRQLKDWLTAQVQARGIAINERALTLMITLIGNDPRMLVSELEKLQSFGNIEITDEHVHLLVVPSGEQILWGLTNLIGEKNPAEALRYMHEQLIRGEDPYALWAIILDMAKKVAMVWAALDAGVSSSNVAKELKLHPFAVRGYLPLAQSMNADQMREWIAFLAENDIALKTGSLKSTAEAPEELIALLERAILTTA